MMLIPTTDEALVSEQLYLRLPSVDKTLFEL